MINKIKAILPENSLINLLYNKQNKAISPKKNSLLTPILPPQNQPKKELQSMPPFKFAPLFNVLNMFQNQSLFVK
jgi:hypothetical protein